jgi:hypothetical protein
MMKVTEMHTWLSLLVQIADRIFATAVMLQLWDHVIHAASACAHSAASRRSRAKRRAVFLEKHGLMPPLPYNFSETEMTLQQLVDSSFLTLEEAKLEAMGEQPAAAVEQGAEGADEADAPPAPDLSAIKVLVYSEYARPDHAKVEDWRKLKPRPITKTLDRPDQPTLFRVPSGVMRGEIGKEIKKRPAGIRHTCVLPICPPQRHRCEPRRAAQVGPGLTSFSTCSSACISPPSSSASSCRWRSSR